VLTPGLELLRTINARPFAARLRSEHAPGSFEKHCAMDMEQALALLARPAESGWLVRREFGAAGRGRRRLHSGRPGADELAWLQASLRQGPLIIEPWVAIEREYTRSAWVRRDGSVLISEPCAQTTTEHGAWVDTERIHADAITRADDEALQAMTERVAKALACRKAAQRSSTRSARSTRVSRWTGPPRWPAIRARVLPSTNCTA
jgi:hypothetical protein